MAHSVPKEFTVGQFDGHRNIALESVPGGGGMVEILAIARDFVDDHGLPVLANFVADRRLELEFVTGFHAEGNVVPHAAGDPAAAP